MPVTLSIPSVGSPSVFRTNDNSRGFIAVRFVYGENGELLRLRIEFPFTEDGAKVVVWQNGKATVWFKDKKGLAVVPQPSMERKVGELRQSFDPKLVMERLKVLYPAGDGRCAGVAAAEAACVGAARALGRRIGTRAVAAVTGRRRIANRRAASARARAAVLCRTHGLIFRTCAGDFGACRCAPNPSRRTAEAGYSFNPGIPLGAGADRVQRRSRRVLIWLIVGHLRIRHWIRSARPLVEERVLTIFNAARQDARMPRSFVVVESARCRRR